MKRESGVEFWYSGDPIGMEYTRACIELNRNNTIQMPTYRCLDSLHHGFYTLQFLFISTFIKAKIDIIFFVLQKMLFGQISDFLSVVIEATLI